MKTYSVRKFIVIVGVLFLVLVVSAPPASAQRLIGALGAGPGTSTLVELHPVTGALIGTIGGVGYRVNGMTWDQTTGTLFATTSNNDATFPDGLISIDLATGAGTPIGTGAGQLVNNPAANSVGAVYGWTESGDDPVLWNTAAGTVTLVGISGISTLAHGLSFDNSDTLYLMDDGVQVYTIDTTSGVATSVGAVTTATGYAHHGDFHPTTNLYYGIETTPWDAGPRTLVVIDAATQTVVSTIPTTIDALHVITFVEGALVSVNVPTIGSYGVAALVLLMAMIAVIVIRRQLV